MIEVQLWLFFWPSKTGSSELIGNEDTLLKSTWQNLKMHFFYYMNCLCCEDEYYIYIYVLLLC